MRGRAARRLVAIALLVLGLVGLGGPEWGRERAGDAYSTWDAGTGGALGLWRLARALGHPVLRWEKPLSFLSEGGALAILCGGRRSVRSWGVYERRWLQRWVAEGGGLWMAGCDPEGLFGLWLRGEPGPCLGASGGAMGEGASSEEVPVGGEREGPVPGTGDCGPERSRPVSIGPGEDRWRGLGATVVLGPAAIEVNDAEAGRGLGPLHVLARTEEGALFAVRRKVGKGEVWLIGSAEPFLNGALRRGDGAVRFGRWLRTLPTGAVVRFDGWRLGEGSAPSAFGWLASRGAWAVWGPLAFLVGGWLWRRGAALGPYRAPHRPVRDATTSLLDALQAAYLRAADEEGLAERLRREALLDVAGRWRLRIDSPAKVAEALRRQGHLEPAKAVEALGRLAVPRDETEWERWACSLQGLVAASSPASWAAPSVQDREGATRESA